MINIINNILSDLSLVYKNFIHWNISKIIIYVSAFLLGLGLALPFFIILLLFFYFDPIEWKDIVSTFYLTNSYGLSFLTALSSYYMYIIIEFVIFLLGVGFFSFGYSYYMLPLSNLYIGYLKGEKIPYFRNIYFNFKLISKYIYILIWGSLVFLVPLIIFAIGFFIALLGLGGIEGVFQAYEEGSFSVFSLIIGIIFLISVLIFLYLAYRISFAYIILLDDSYKLKDEEDKGLVNKIMIGVVVIHVLFVILGAFLSFSFGMAPFVYITVVLVILNVLSVLILYKIRKYLVYVIESFKITGGFKIFKFLLVVIIYSILMFIVEFISGATESLGYFGYYGFTIIIFLLFSGLFEMLFVSIYRNIMMNGLVFRKEETKIEEKKIVEVVIEEKTEIVIEEKNDNNR